jgi:hypothetical protein
MENRQTSCRHGKIHMEKQKKIIVTLISVQIKYCTLNIYLFSSTHLYVFSKSSLSTSPLTATFSEYNCIFYIHKVTTDYWIIYFEQMLLHTLGQMPKIKKKCNATDE